MRLPLRARLTLVFAILVALMLVATGLFVFVRFRQDVRGAVDAGLSSRAQTLLAGIEEGNVLLGDRGGLIEGDEAFTQVVDAKGEVLDSSSMLEERPLLSRETIAGLVGPTYVDSRVRTVEEIVNARLLAAPSREGLIVIVGASLEEQEEAAAGLAGALMLGGAGALAVTALIGWLVAGAGLRPVERMRSEAAAISAASPGRRLPVPNTGDELARLAETLNDMLSRLEQAIERERRFVDDASHELRTPLGILKTELDLALRKARTAEELEAALRSAAEESDRLNSLAEDLLILARSDRGLLPVRAQRVDVARLANEVAARFGTRAKGRGINIDVHTEEPGTAEVDPARLRQALGNLIDNALRHTPEGGTIDVRIVPTNGRLTMQVADSGAGFPQDFIARAFEPFTRVDAGRTRAAGGAGLGLAIVKAVAESHGGTAEARNRPDGGAIVTISIPVRFTRAASHALIGRPRGPRNG